ncbi:MAG: hypothetical protein K2X35_03995 [Bryobacteraceae bacterium]|nr:hypothetical protein [Bryobacteraceae bacterium]
MGRSEGSSAGVVATLEAPPEAASALSDVRVADLQTVELPVPQWLALELAQSARIVATPPIEELEPVLEESLASEPIPEPAPEAIAEVAEPPAAGIALEPDEHPTVEIEVFVPPQPEETAQDGLSSEAISVEEESTPEPEAAVEAAPECPVLAFPAQAAVEPEPVLEAIPEIAEPAEQIGSIEAADPIFSISAEELIEAARAAETAEPPAETVTTAAGEELEPMDASESDAGAMELVPAAETAEAGSTPGTIEPDPAVEPEAIVEVQPELEPEPVAVPEVPQPEVFSETVAIEQTPEDVNEIPEPAMEPAPVDVVEAPEPEAEFEPEPMAAAEAPEPEFEPEPAAFAETTENESEPEPIALAETTAPELEPEPIALAESIETEFEPEPAAAAGPRFEAVEAPPVEPEIAAEENAGIRALASVLAAEPAMTPVPADQPMSEETLLTTLPLPIPYEPAVPMQAMAGAIALPGVLALAEPEILPEPPPEVMLPPEPEREPEPPLAGIRSLGSTTRFELTVADQPHFILAHEPSPSFLLPGPMLTQDLEGHRNSTIVTVLGQRQKRSGGIPGWAVTLMVTLIVLITGASVLFYRAPGDPAQVTPAVTSPSAAASNPLANYIQVTGVRFLMNYNGKNEVHYLVVNQSNADMTDIALNITIRSVVNDQPISSFSIHLNRLAPYESKELSTTIEKLPQPFTTPDWRDVKTDVDIQMK